MNYDDKSGGGYPHPQQQQGMQAMPMPMPPPTYDQSGQHQGLYPPMPAPPPQSHIHYVAPHPPPVMNEPVQTTHTIIIQPQVGPDPTMVTCPSCRQTVVSRMEYESSTRTHVAAGILCLVGCWLCCCFPYCMDSCRNGNHYCPSCGSFLGTYRS